MKTPKDPAPYYSRIAYDNIIRFIRARRFGDMTESTRCQKWLKKRFGSTYSSVLLQHGDPDANNYQNYEAVITAWQEESYHADR